ncbi:ATP-binding protein [Catellatospora citrea]|uniref:LuxR family transcriptional regulator n=1 Tax=Catellatospora citrea TaxID=53366 RepID=A0A8J3K955_9ACTN|nr:AAA family ATPase [Catellatospora citrea]GIF96419.1 LuxR family transcriptional regulator [Catellatospora citrea]
MIGSGGHTMRGGGTSVPIRPVRLRGPVEFVGRTAELALLRRLVAAPPSLVLLEGEPGIGKSRLVAELLAGLPGHHLVGECDDVPEPFPLGVLLDAVRAGADRLGSLNPVAGALAPLLPELAGVLPPAPAPLADAAAERHRLLRALAAVLEGLAPAVLVLEDLHWADPVTCEFLAYLSTRPVDGLAVVLTARTPAPGAGTPIHDALARTPPWTVTRVPLGPLDAAEVRQLAARTLGLGDPPPELTATLLDRTAGIPFVVEEVLRTLAERGGDPMADDSVPFVLRDVLLWRLKPLDEPVREVLGAAAVLGNMPDRRLLAAALGQDRAQVDAALTAAHRAGLLHDAGDGLRFRHDLARQVVYHLVPQQTREWLHLRVARVLEQELPRPVAQLAHHYRLAGSGADFVRNAETAADLATERGDDATAADFLLQTMDVAELPRPVRARLAGKLGRAAIDGLSQASAIPVLERLLADRRLPPGARGELGLVLGRMLRQQGEASRGYVEIERALPYLRTPRRRAQALAVLAAPDTVVGRHVDYHLARCAEAEAAADAGGDPAARLAVRIARASLLLELNDPAAWAIIADLRACDELADRPREHARACLNWAQGALHAGYLDQAAELLADGRELVAQTGYERLSALVEATALSLDRAAGRLSGLAERFAQLIAATERMPVTTLDARAELATVLALTAGAGDAERAERALREVIAEARRVGAVWPLVQALSAAARLLLARRPDEAVWHANEAVLLVRGKGIWAWAADAVLVLAEAAVAAGAPARAADVVAELAAGLDGRHAPVAAAVLRRCRELIPG